MTDGSRDISANAFLAKLSSSVILATVSHGKPEMRLLDIRFIGWPRPKANVKRISVIAAYPSTGVVWVNDAPIFSPGPSPDPKVAQGLIGKVLNQIAGQAQINRKAFQGPFDIVAVDSEGVHWLSGDRRKCEDARKAALSKSQ